MTFRNLFYFITLGFMVTGLVRCNNKSSSSSPPPPACPLGQIATPAGCAPPSTITPPINYIPPTGINGLTQYFASKTDTMSTQDSLNLTSNYSLFLRDALGVCDRCSTTIGEAVQCNSWVRGFNMLMLSFSNVSTATNQLAFYSTPYISQPYFQFAWQFPKIEDFFITLFTGIAPPSCNQGQFSPYWATEVYYTSMNGGQGFVMYVNQGPFYSKWNRHKFRLSVPVGKIGDPQFNFQLSVIDTSGNSSDLATGTLTRCQTPNCSMF